MSTPSEEKTGDITRLEWSGDNDNFFSDDGNENTDACWDDNSDVDRDLDIRPDGNNIDDINLQNVENTLNPDDAAMDTISAANEHENETGAFLSLPQTTSLPNPTPSNGTIPSSDSKPTQSKEKMLSTSITDSLDDPEGPKESATVSCSNDSCSGPVLVHGTPFPQSGTMATPLVELEDEDEKFEEILRKRNRVRKEREEYHIAHIKVQMGRLEDALAAETKRRVDATIALDELARTQVHEMEERVRGQLQEENKRLQSRLGALEERVRLLEENWMLDSNNQIKLVNSKAADLSKSIEQIRDDQNMERKSRLKREGILLQQVEGYAKESEQRWTSEHNDRVQRLKKLEDQIIRNEARLALEQKRHEDRIETELTSLKEELEIEVAERQTQDEEIVAALNRYTQQLQHSLSILSSD
mmetsp:Transcript_5732/g.14315  ORF Transcript_5732/g.14315 Transcript_5732/m.14315 type:complete len:415 (-) Transcript_5732:1408-2652(-)|eukprot:CAMPEP_0197189236 /NCGR_PEP_ID=MMETSP1423-20130617/19405_1 /TAXON_ID=476441 /ORGANISM="Pseudo-nitzschia heimii, Strain UNC1101" /LENGTH=414 /DNA_ID=CAMNT_0042641293 /DNA_START=22 /DNA_END=1266 /DNA_ORIENTATION=-